MIHKNIKKIGKTVGKKITAPIKWAGKQIEKEMKMDKAKDDKYRMEGEKMMKDKEYYKAQSKYGTMK